MVSKPGIRPAEDYIYGADCYLPSLQCNYSQVPRLHVLQNGRLDPQKEISCPSQGSLTKIINDAEADLTADPPDKTIALPP